MRYEAEAAYKKSNTRTSATQIMTSTIPPASSPPPQPSSRMTEEVAQFITRSSTPVRQFDNLGDVPAVAVLPEGRRMATASEDGILRLWDLKNGVLLKELEGLGREMGSMALSRDGQLIASCDNGGNVIAWNIDTSRRLTRGFRPHESSSCLLDFSPDGATLATASDTMTKLWNTETWQVQGQPIDCGIFRVNCVRYSPSGQLLAIATNHGSQSWEPKDTIQVWNPATRQCIAKFGEGATSVSLLWTPDGTCLLSIGNPTIRQWDSSTWMQVRDIWKGNVGSCIAVNCNGTLVAYPTTCNQIRVRRLSDEQTIAIFQHSDLPYCITFSVDGKYILAGGKDKKISQWAVPKHAWPEDVPKDQPAHKVCLHSFLFLRHLTYPLPRLKTTVPGLETSVQKLKVAIPMIKTLKPRHVYTLESYNAIRGCFTQILAMNMTVRNACITGDLPTAEELLTQAIDVNGDNYRSYAIRAVVMARKLDWDNALRDATKVRCRPGLPVP
jgi:WD40 repeat protein